jgi:thiol-disulfide isomerase/thioredoxin
MKLRTVLSASLVLMLTAGAFAQEKKLSVGDAAPGLDIEKWVKGSETTLEEGNVYVVEFWATWCGPCKKSIPHLSELQKRHSDDGMTIIGVSSEEAKVVEKFVRAQGEKMAYTVAVDRRESTKRAWMEAAKQNGIPCAFIVDRKGKIAFIGHPLDDEFESTLKQVLTGRFDAKLQKQADPVLTAARNARTLKNWRSAMRYYDDVINLDPAVFASIALEKFQMILVDMDDRQQAYDYARKLMDEVFANDAGALQMLVEKVVTDPKIEESKRNTEFALEAAEASRRLSNGDPPSLASVALVHYKRGEFDKAIDLQKKAWMSAPAGRKSEFKRVLTIYQGAGEKAVLSSRKP